VQVSARDDPALHPRPGCRRSWSRARQTIDSARSAVLSRDGTPCWPLVGLRGSTSGHLRAHRGRRTRPARPRAASMRARSTLRCAYKGPSTARPISQRVRDPSHRLAAARWEPQLAQLGEETGAVCPGPVRRTLSAFFSDPDPFPLEIVVTLGGRRTIRHVVSQP